MTRQTEGFARAFGEGMKGMGQHTGASSGPGSYPTGQAACGVCGASRFDPSRSTPVSCPFCGNEKVQTNTKAKSYFAKQQAKREKRDTSNYLCRCTRCGAKGPLTHSREAAVAAWNGRYEAEAA